MKSFNLIIPCYNEEGNIKNLFYEIKYFLNKIKRNKYLKIKILLIENGSTDQTKNIVKLALKDLELHKIEI